MNLCPNKKRKQINNAYMCVHEWTSEHQKPNLAFDICLHVKHLQMEQSAWRLYDEWKLPVMGTLSTDRWFFNELVLFAYGFTSNVRVNAVLWIKKRWIRSMYCTHFIQKAPISQTKFPPLDVFTGHRITTQNIYRWTKVQYWILENQFN